MGVLGRDLKVLQRVAEPSAVRGSVFWLPQGHRCHRCEGVTCLILRCTHSRYENEMTPQLDSRPRLLTTRTNSGTERPEID
ncbi:hypothetical protein JHK82_040952 [Glycine max]|nr:hypothetical protein JHK82_040952 [Glycine max]